MTYLEEADLMNAAARARGELSAQLIRAACRRFALFTKWMRWTSEIALTSRRLGPVEGPRGPLAG